MNALLALFSWLSLSLGFGSPPGLSGTVPPTAAAAAAERVDQTQAKAPEWLFWEANNSDRIYNGF